MFGMSHRLVDLYQVCSNYAPGSKNDPAQGHVLQRHNGNMKNLLKTETARPRALIFVTSSTGLLPSLLKLWP